jgi:lipopolysaccharide export system permease protein
MLQNKIYLNYLSEIFKTFITILLGLSLIALTVRAVNFLDLIVESGYSVTTYFHYSLLNLFGITPKFIPFSFLLCLMIFIIKHGQDSEFTILWTSGVEKIQLVNLFFLNGIIIMILYILLSGFISPFALNKSRQLLSEDQLNSFLPTIKTQQFSDSFKGLTFIVDKKSGNEINNIFLHDKSNNLKNLSSNISDTSSTTIIARNGIVEKQNLFLMNGEIISSKKDNSKNEIIKFDQLKIDLTNLTTTTIKKPKLQETSTLKLFSCFLKKEEIDSCEKNLKKEIITTLNRRLVLPLYIPVIALICSLLLIKNKKKYWNKISIFSICFILLLFTELSVRYTGINNYIKILFITLPGILIITFYLFLKLRFSNELKKI